MLLSLKNPLLRYQKLTYQRHCESNQKERLVYSIKTTITKLKEKLEYQEHQHKRQVFIFFNFNIDFVFYCHE